MASLKDDGSSMGKVYELGGPEVYTLHQLVSILHKFLIFLDALKRCYGLSMWHTIKENSKIPVWNSFPHNSVTSFEWTTIELIVNTKIGVIAGRTDVWHDTGMATICENSFPYCKGMKTLMLMRSLF